MKSWTYVGDHKQENWTNLETTFSKTKNSRVTYKDSAIQKLIHCNAKYKFLCTSFIAQNTLFNLTNNKNKKQDPALFCIITVFNNYQTELMRNLKA